MWRWRISFPVLVGAGLLVAPSAAQDHFQSVPPVQPSKPAPPHPHRPPRPPSANQNAQPDTTAVTPQPPVASTTVTGRSLGTRPPAGTASPGTNRRNSAPPR